MSFFDIIFAPTSKKVLHTRAHSTIILPHLPRRSKQTEHAGLAQW